VAPQERTDDNSECDEDAKTEYGDLFHFGDYNPLSPEIGMLFNRINLENRILS
jgi:hypothetical protein